MDSNLVISPNNNSVAFALGVMWGKAPGGGSYDIPFGLLQDCQLDGKFTLKEARDPNLRTAAAVGIAAGELTLKAKQASLRGRALLQVLGGTLGPATGSPVTTSLLITAANFRPVAFAIQIMSRNDPVNAEVIGTVYKAVGEQWSLAMKPEDFVMYDQQFKCYGDPANNNNLANIQLQGDQTTDTASVPAAPTAPSATAGGAGTGAIDLAWTAATGATGYTIYRSVTSGSGYVWVGDTVGVKFRDYGTSATTYYYVITAVGATGQSPYSTQVSAVAP